jgi:CheY-like chemotaxis protein
MFENWSDTMKKPNVLVVDDDPTMRRVLQTKLSKLGYDVTEACDGLEVLSQCYVGWVGTVILDHEMPNANGRSVARVIRSRCDAPIVFLSGHRKEQFQSIVMELPNVYYLSKPLEDDKLATLLASLVALSPELRPTVTASSEALQLDSAMEPLEESSAVPMSAAAGRSSNPF